MSKSSDSIKLPRRDALKLLATAAAVPSLACDRPLEPEIPRTPADPDLVNPVTPWEHILTADELRTVTALSDVIIPADDRSPSASQVGVPEYINEYVSAPYPAQERDRVLIRGGLAWLNTESNRRFSMRFADLTFAQQREICDDICYVPDATPEYQGAARFFDKFRDLVATGFYTTDAGMRDIGYVGNVAMAQFNGPPPEVLRYLNLDA
jgi:hypothetical protein